MVGEHVKRSIEVVAGDQEVEVSEGSERRVDIIQVGNGGAFQYEVLDATGILKPLFDIQETLLQFEAPPQRTLMRSYCV